MRPCPGSLLDARQDDQFGPDVRRSLHERLARRVRTEVGDPPAASRQADAEPEQAEAVALALGTRQQRARALAGAPAARGCGEPVVDQRGDEMLLPRSGLALLPCL